MQFTKWSTQFRTYFAVSLLFLLRLKLSSCQGIWEDPPCDMDYVQQCLDRVYQSMQATGCNWYRILEPLRECIEEATAGCTYEQQEEWYKLVDDFNITLNGNDCNRDCIEQNLRAEEMFQCFITYDYDNVIKEISANKTQRCGALDQLQQCVILAVRGCPALQDVVYNRTSANAAAFAKCSLLTFPPATTLAPVAIENTDPASSTAATSSTDNGGINTGELLLVILGCILIVATIIAIISVIAITIRRRRAYRQSILREWKPNGQRAYHDEPPNPRDVKYYRPVKMPYGPIA